MDIISLLLVAFSLTTPSLTTPSLTTTTTTSSFLSTLPSSGGLLFNISTTAYFLYAPIALSAQLLAPIVTIPHDYTITQSPCTITFSSDNSTVYGIGENVVVASATLLTIANNEISLQQITSLTQSTILQISTNTTLQPLPVPNLNTRYLEYDSLFYPFSKQDLLNTTVSYSPTPCCLCLSPIDAKQYCRRKCDYQTPTSILPQLASPISLNLIPLPAFTSSLGAIPIEVTLLSTNPIEIVSFNTNQENNFTIALKQTGKLSGILAITNTKNQAYLGNVTLTEITTELNQTIISKVSYFSAEQTVSFSIVVEDWNNNAVLNIFNSLSFSNFNKTIRLSSLLPTPVPDEGLISPVVQLVPSNNSFTSTIIVCSIVGLFVLSSCFALIICCRRMKLNEEKKEKKENKDNDKIKQSQKKENEKNATASTMNSLETIIDEEAGRRVNLDKFAQIVQ